MNRLTQFLGISHVENPIADTHTTHILSHVDYTLDESHTTLNGVHVSHMPLVHCFSLCALLLLLYLPLESGYHH